MTSLLLPSVPRTVQAFKTRVFALTVLLVVTRRSWLRQVRCVRWPAYGILHCRLQAFYRCGCCKRVLEISSSSGLLMQSILGVGTGGKKRQHHSGTEPKILCANGTCWALTLGPLSLELSQDFVWKPCVEAFVGHSFTRPRFGGTVAVLQSEIGAAFSLSCTVANPVLWTHSHFCPISWHWSRRYAVEPTKLPFRSTPGKNGMQRVHNVRPEVGLIKCLTEILTPLCWMRMRVLNWNWTVMLDFFSLVGNIERKMLLTLFSSGWPPCMELWIHALPAPVAPLCYLICKYPPFNRDIRSSSSVRMVFSILCQEADCVVIMRQH